MSLDIVEETGSTNSDLLDRVAAGRGREGDWLVARRQSAGRGRLGRSWAGQEGNFHGSTIVTLRSGDPPPPTLALATALAVQGAVVDATRGHISPAIKWPNDLLVGAAKLGGILLERSGDAIVVGIGVNLAWAPELADRATTSLGDAGIAVGVDMFLDTLAATFAAELHRWRSEPLSALIARWLERAHPVGTALTVSDGADAGLTGAFDGLDTSGNLRLRLTSGETRIIHAGEIRLAAAP